MPDAKFLAETPGKTRATNQLVPVEDQRGIAVDGLLLRAGWVPWIVELPQALATWNGAVLGAAASRTPATMIDAHRDRSIQCPSIHPGLSAGHDSRGDVTLIRRFGLLRSLHPCFKPRFSGCEASGSSHLGDLRRQSPNILFRALEI